MNTSTEIKKLSAKDYASDQDVRWCPGCGDYAILKSIQKTLAELEARPEKTVFISGIGCSSRFPYYLSTYGFHTIHGRAPAIATGVKLANPTLDVWVITGDGDGLSIGGNHLLHALRRNVDLNILLFNNEIYGLTKGQYSPTSRPGTTSPSTPDGSIDTPVSPCGFALGAEARFIARTIDTDLKRSPDVFKRAHEHKGASFIEIFQNCIVYNDNVFKDFTDKDTAEDRQLYVQHGETLLFGKNNNQGLRFNQQTFSLEIITIGENGFTESDVLKHDEKNKILASMLINLSQPRFPMVLGVLYCAPTTAYEADVQANLKNNWKNAAPCTDINALLKSGRIWDVQR